VKDRKRNEQSSEDCLLAAGHSVWHRQGQQRAIDMLLAPRNAPQLCVGQLCDDLTHVVLTYASAEHLLDKLPSDDVLGCLILGARLHPGMSGPELQDRLIKLGVMLPMQAIVRDERHSLREKQALGHVDGA
jgi:hypothetical protein